MDDEEDVKKMNDFINKQKANYQSNFQLEFQDFINFKLECNSEQEDDDDDDDDDNHDLVIVNQYNSVHEENQGTEHPSGAPVLTEDEQNIINTCKNPELKKLLVLNRTKNLQLIKFHKKLQELLLECVEEMEDLADCTSKSLESKQMHHQTFIWKLAAPYFKDKKFFTSPRNEDATNKKYRNELSIYDLTPSPKWTPVEFDRLTNAVKCHYNINRQKDINVKINQLKMKMQPEDPDDKKYVEEILSLKNQLEELKQDENKVPPLNSNEFINWYKVSETFLKDKHTPTECQAVWNMLLHPSINKTEWSEEENKNLEKIAKRHAYQNWSKIAFELGTNRTEFTTCLHYFSKLCDKFKKSKFTPEEDEFLLEVIDIYKIGTFIPWNKVVCHFTDRSRHQLYHRFTYFLSQNHVKRGKFSEAEDVLLIILVNKFGRNFKKCAEYMPHRSQVQLKSRYNSNLQRHIKKGTFTTDDDKLIYDYVKKHGEKSWSVVAKKLDRCNAQIRQRYKLIKSFLRNNPTAPLSQIPKRKHRFDEINEGQHTFLNYIAEQYKNVSYIPTLSMIENNLQVNLAASTSTDSPNSENVDNDVAMKNIDVMLTDFFCSSVNTRQSNVMTEANLNEAFQNVQELVKLLDANLNVPKSLEPDIDLDNIDLEILERISMETSKMDESEMKLGKLVPPNLSCLVGLKKLIMKHKEHKIRYTDTKYGKWPMSLKNLDEEVRNELLKHRSMYSKRFEVLFHWSAVNSLEKPNVTNINSYHSKRPNTQGDNSVVKKRKIEASVLANLSQQVKNSQVKIIDKSTMEKLLKNNNVTVLELKNIKGKSILKRRSQDNGLTEASDNTSADEQVTIDEGLQEDVDRLNGILKSVKSEVTKFSPTRTDEYQAIEDDVLLLKQILENEKVKVKPDPDNFLSDNV